MRSHGWRARRAPSCSLWWTRLALTLRRGSPAACLIVRSFLVLTVGTNPSCQHQVWGEHVRCSQLLAECLGCHTGKPTPTGRMIQTNYPERLRRTSTLATFPKCSSNWTMRCPHQRTRGLAVIATAALRKGLPKLENKSSSWSAGLSKTHSMSVHPAPPARVSAS